MLLNLIFTTFNDFKECNRNDISYNRLVLQTSIIMGHFKTNSNF